MKMEISLTWNAQINHLGLDALQLQLADSPSYLSNENWETKETGQMRNCEIREMMTMLIR